MRKVEVEVYSDAANYAVMRHPNRQFPGMLVQGDSLSILASQARSVHELALETGDRELVDAALTLKEDLCGRLKFYEEVLTEHGIALPYITRQG